MTRRIALIVDQDDRTRRALSELLDQKGFDPRQCSSVDDAVTLLEDTRVDLVLTELDFSGRPEGHQLLALIRRLQPHACVAVVSEELGTERLLDCMHAGATDCIAKPVQDEDIDRLLDCLARPPARVREEPVRETASVLVLEGDWVLRDRYHDMLSSHGYRVSILEHVVPLESFVQEHDIDLVLIDHNFLGQRSFTFIERLTTSDGAGHVPVLVMGPADDRRVIVRSFQVGAADYLPRPVQTTDLILTTRRLVEWKQSYDKLREARDRADRRRRSLTQETLFFKELNRFLDLDEKVDVVRRKLPELVGAEHVAVAHFDADHMKLHLLASSFGPLDSCPTLDLDDDSLARTVLGTRQPRHLDDLAASGDPVPPMLKGLDVRRLWCLPMMTGQQTWGVLYMVNVHQVEATLTHEEMVSRVVEHLTSSLQNALLYDETRRLATTDGLTGLANHKAMVDLLGYELERVARYGTEVSVVMFDLDNFKAINDTWGHPQGDQVLVEVARLLKTHIRTVDRAARYGGEEFLVVLPDTAKKLAESFARRLRALIEDRTFTALDGHSTIRCTISAGVAAAPEDGKALAELLKIVDGRLYQAKRSGKNAVISR